MYTNIEFSGTEPIENVITSMHFQIDRIIFFGYQEIIKEYRKQTESFLKKYCNVKEVYELETVASRFGGKYTRKVLAALQPITGVYAERAKEMGIELWCCE